MSNLEIGADGWQSLAQLLALGKMPAGEALHHASLLAEALRKIHEGGRVHGFLTPAAVWLNGQGVEITPPLPGAHALTPYTPPELLAGRAADCQSDIFSFGAILYEMLTGHRAFSGETPAALVQSLRSSQLASTGNAAADKLLAACLAKDPSHRWHQIHKLELELRLLSAEIPRPEGRRPQPAAGEPEASFPQSAGMQPAPDHAMNVPQPASPPIPAPAETAPSVFQTSPFQPPAAAHFPPESTPGLAPPAAYYPAAPDYSAIRGEVQQAETRMLAARLQVSEQAMADLHHAVVDAVAGLRNQLSALTAQAPGQQDRLSLMHAGSESAVPSGSLARIEQALESFAARLETVERGMAAMEERVARAEQEAEGAKQQVNLLHGAIAEDFLSFEQTLQKQEKAVDSARTAMAQTDDLVERLVEALEALQSTVLERPGDLTAAAVN